jgi:replicative DNA helicase
VAAQFAVTAPSHALFDHAPGLTFEDLRRKISNVVMRHGIRGVILDYWQLVGGVERDHTQAMHQDRVAQFLADTARREGIWVIAMAHLNQDGNTRGGEGIRLASDQAFELHRDPDSEGRLAADDRDPAHALAVSQIEAPARPLASYARPLLRRTRREAGESQREGG